MVISTGNRPKGMVVGMSATPSLTVAEGPTKPRQKAARPPKLALPKRRKPKLGKGSSALAAVLRMTKL